MFYQNHRSVASHWPALLLHSFIEHTSSLVVIELKYLEAICTDIEAIGTDLEAICTDVEAIGTDLEAIGTYFIAYFACLATRFRPFVFLLPKTFNLCGFQIFWFCVYSIKVKLETETETQTQTQTQTQTGTETETETETRGMH